MKLSQDTTSYLHIITTLALIIISQNGALTYPLTGQYMGTQSSGNEHVLLFKLPRSVSDQVQGHLETKKNNEQVSSSNQFLHRATPYFRENRIYETQPLIEEQSLSLTIPLSSLRAATAASNQPEYLYTVPQQSSDNYSRQPTRTSVRYDSPLVDYLSAESSGHEVIEQKLVDPFIQITSSDQHSISSQDEQAQQPQQKQQQQQQQYVDSPVTHNLHQQQVSNLTSLEQQMRSFLQRQSDNFTTTNLPMLASTTDLPVLNQDQVPQLWLETQNSSLREPVRISNKSGQDQQLSTTLLSKLASSSPDLLLRLKSLLQRTAAQSQPTEVVNSLSDYPKGEAADDNHHSQALRSIEKHSPLDKTLLNTFLASQNLSSHEEIEIPLVVIAMPRIISLKRNQVMSKYPSSSYTVDGQKQSTTASGNLNPSYSRNSTLSNLPIKLSLLELAGNKNNNTNSTSNQSPYIYLTSRNASPYSNLLESDVSQQDVNSEPHHTMAPYARQFSLPTSDDSYPLTLKRIYQPIGETVSQVQYPSSKIELQVPTNKTNEFGEQAVHYVYPSSQSASTEGSQSIGARSNITSFIQLSQNNPRQNDEIYQPRDIIHYASSAQANHRERRIPQLSQYERVQVQDSDSVSRPKNLIHSADAQRLAELTYPHLNELRSRLNYQQQYRYPRTQNQALNETGTETTWLVDQLPARQEYSSSESTSLSPAIRQVRHSSTSMSDLSSAHNRISMLEQRLARLRPLFRGNRSGSQADIKDQLRLPGNKLTRDQMLSLFPSASQYDQNLNFSAASRRQDQQIPKESSRTTDGARSKKAPNMVLMIV